MNADFLTGFATRMALIVTIGSQNAFVLQQGIRRERVLAVVVFCGVSDAFLIFLGVAGAGAVLSSNAALMAVARYGGALFLFSVMACWRRGAPGQVPS